MKFKHVTDCEIITAYGYNVSDLRESVSKTLYNLHKESEEKGMELYGFKMDFFTIPEERMIGVLMTYELSWCEEED